MGWKIPDWLRQYEDLFVDKGPHTVEELMNTSVSVAELINIDPVKARALLANAQVSLLVALRARGVLKDVPPCPLQKAVPAGGAEALPEAHTPGPQVVAAAVRCASDGVIVLGIDHAFAIGSAMTYHGADVFVEGFVDAVGAFLTRAEAYERAVRCGQIADKVEKRILTTDTLISAYLWGANP